MVNDLITQDNIKKEVSIYFMRKKNDDKKIFSLFDNGKILTPKYAMLFTEQNTLFNKHIFQLFYKEITVNEDIETYYIQDLAEEIKNHIENLIKIKIIPERYAPVEENITPKYLKLWLKHRKNEKYSDFCHELELYKLNISVSLISLLEEKNEEIREKISPFKYKNNCKIMSFLKELSSKTEGITFEDAVNKLLIYSKNVWIENGYINNISKCSSCLCMTKTINGKCGKCENIKK